MSQIDGPWKIEIATPMGTQKLSLQLAADGETLTGTATDHSNEMEIRDGRIDGDAVGFGVETKLPFPMSIRFSLTLDGDSLSGTSVAGSFPPATVTGTRAG